jgi:hypothetical protein
MVPKPPRAREHRTDEQRHPHADLEEQNHIGGAWSRCFKQAFVQGMASVRAAALGPLIPSLRIWVERATGSTKENLPARLFIPGALRIFRGHRGLAVVHRRRARNRRERTMLLRKDGLDVIAIPQPSHAWLSGQMARAWGNEHFAAPMPYDEVCLATGQHDIGWLDWEMRPVLDAGTGLPQEFFRVPSKVHIALWREGVRRARVFGRYPALLVSLHADTIYAQYFNFNKASVENAEAVRAFLDEQHRIQARMAASMRADPKLAEQASPETIEHNRLLIAALDRMSLEICWGVKKEIKIPNVPTAGVATAELRMQPRAGEGLVLDPWPFRMASVAVRAEGKRLRGRFATDADLHRALDEAEPVLVTAVLHRA